MRKPMTDEEIIRELKRRKCPLLDMTKEWVVRRIKQKGKKK